MGPQDAVRAIWGRNCRKASVIEIVVYNDHESRTLVNEGGTAEIFPFVPLHNAGGMKGFFICGRSGKDFLRGKMHGSSKRCIKFNLYKSEGRSVSLADDFHTDVGNRYAAPLGFSIGCRLYSELDDAIVVVENVERIMEEEKLPPYEATKKAMNGLAGALIATSLVLCAVFVPVSFLSGITGQLYRQFTITIAVSVLISTVVALTLSPVMCSLILKPDNGKKKNIVFRKINHWLNVGNHKYVIAIRRVIGNPRRVLAGFGVVLIGILLIHRLIPTSFLPVEDQGYFKIELELPEGATLERTREVTDRAITYLEKNPYIAYVQNVTGSSPRVGSNHALS